MKLEVFTLCDAATECSGKLNVLGSFDHIWAREAPVTYSMCAVAAKIRFERVEEGAHRLRINFADEDGKLVVPNIETQVEVRIPPGENTAVANVILNLHQIKLPSYGEYALDLAIDGRQEGSIPLYVRERKEAVPI